MTEPVVGALIRSQDKANKCMKVIILHKAKGILRFWKRKSSTQNCLKLRRYCWWFRNPRPTAWDVYDLVNNGRYSTFSSTGERRIPAINIMGQFPAGSYFLFCTGTNKLGLKSTCYQWVPELSWVFGSTYTKRWQVIKNSTEWAGVLGTFREIFKKQFYAVSACF